MGWATRRGGTKPKIAKAASEFSFMPSFTNHPSHYSSTTTTHEFAYFRLEIISSTLLFAKVCFLQVLLGSEFCSRAISQQQRLQSNFFFWSRPASTSGVSTSTHPLHNQPATSTITLRRSINDHSTDEEPSTLPDTSVLVFPSAYRLYFNQSPSIHPHEEKPGRDITLTHYIFPRKHIHSPSPLLYSRHFLTMLQSSILFFIS